MRTTRREPPGPWSWRAGTRAAGSQWVSLVAWSAAVELSAPLAGAGLDSGVDRVELGEAGRGVLGVGAAALTPLSPNELEVLEAVSSWLACGGGKLVVPHRERSLQVLGDEKRLDSLAASRLFAHGVLSFELLACEWVPPQLPWRRVGEGSVALVVENAATFRTVTRALSVDPGRYGVVAAGGGNAFVRTVAGLADPEVGQVSELRYFGDLDIAGLEIPQRASVEAERVGLPAPSPAAGLYRLLLARSEAQPVPTVDTERAERAAAWLCELAEPALAVLALPGRIAQEAVGSELLAEEPEALER